MENRDNLRRIIIATVISFIFFFAYDYFVLQPSMKNTGEVNKTQEIKTTNSKLKKANTNLEIKEVAKIEAKNYEAVFDSLGRISKFTLKENKFNTKGKHLELIPSKLPKPLEIRFSKKEKLN